MSATPDRHPGELSEEGIVFDDVGAGNDPTLLGGFRYVDGAFRMKDSLGVFNPRNDGGTADLSKVLLSVAGTIMYIGDGDILVKA